MYDFWIESSKSRFIIVLSVKHFFRKKVATFSKSLWVFNILKISKNEKKMKIDNFFSMYAYKWAFFSKSAFFDLFAWKMLKKVLKNHESKGCSKRFLSIFAIFEKFGLLVVYYYYGLPRIKSTQNFRPPKNFRSTEFSEYEKLRL